MLIHCDGFDHYATAQAVSGQKWDTVVQATISATFARSGGQGCQLGNLGASLIKNVTAATTYIIGAAILLNSGAFSQQLFSFWDSTTLQSSIVIASDGTLTAHRGDQSGALLGTATVKYPLGSYHYLEAKCTVDPTAGAVTVRMDGVVILTLTGQNTRTTGTSQITRVGMGAVGGGQTWWVDDIYICDTTTPNSAGNNNADFLGDVKVNALYPNAAGAFTNYTRGGTDTGHDYGQVNEVTPPDEDTTYIVDGTIGDRDSFKFPAISLVGSIFAAVVWARARKDDAGSRSLANVARSSAVDTIGSTYTLGATYQYFGTVFELDPATTALWTPAGITLAEFGVKTIT